MKKTLTINLSGIVYHIDEDAYQLLDKYLKDIKSHLRHTEDVQEVLNDIENRISELFSEKVNQGTQVITIEYVETVIQRMGEPETYAEGETEEEPNEQQQREPEPQQRHRKRLYRDPDNQMLGGVAAGIAAYIDCDPTWVRLAFVALTFCYGVTFPIYIICWFIMPKAETAAEKLEMQGKEVTLENIGKTVTETFNQVSDNVSSFVQSPKTRTAFQRAGDTIATLASVCVKFLALLVGALSGFVLFGLVVGLVSVLAVYFSGKTMSWSFIEGSPFAHHPEIILLLTFTGSLIAAIPFYALLHALLKNNLRWKPMPSSLKWSLLALWFLAIFVTIYAGIYLNSLRAY